jgi:hypothetical protein
MDEGLRHKIREGNYLYVSENAIMFTSAEENNPVNSEFRAMMECICRLTSKALANGVPREHIIKQMISADGGRNTILSVIAEKMGA